MVLLVGESGLALEVIKQLPSIGGQICDNVGCGSELQFYESIVALATDLWHLKKTE